VNAGKKSRLPEIGSGSRRVSCQENNIGGKIFGLAAEAVGGPGTERGVSLAIQSGMKNELCGAVIELCRVERFHNAEFVGDSSEMGKKRGKFVSTHAMFR
jgi:hypothetical protein